jgi:Ca-activated chloride channel homolog
VDGMTIHTSLNESMLQQIAKISGGVYYNATNDKDLANIYKGIVPQLVVKPEKVEVTAILAGLGMLILLVGGVFSLFWYSRLP